MPNAADKFKTFPRIVPLTKGDFVGKELFRRKKETFGKNASPRTIWIRAISNAVKYSKETGIESIKGNKNVLAGGLLSEKFNTRGSFETLYARPGRQMRDKPIPGIDGISIMSKGEVQSLRKVTINWSCPNLEDLNVLTPYWLTPGVSIWLEWGWGQIGKRPITAPIGDNDVKKLAEYYLDAGKLYEDVIRLSEGNQDAYIGIITNFSMNPSDDGSWTCTTELTSLGQTLLSLDLNKDKVTKNASISEKSEQQKTQTIKGFIEDKFTEGNLINLPIMNVTKHPLAERAGQTWGDTGDVLNLTRSRGFLWLEDNKTYVTWRFIEQAIINDHAAFQFSGEAGSGKIFEMDSEKVQISNDFILYTTDANVGLVVHEAANGAVSFDVKGNPQAGYISNLYFESTFVKDTFLNAETLEEALMKILQGMSSACGDIWNFKLQPDPLTESKVQAIDLKFVSGDDVTNTRNSFDAEISSDDKILSLGGYSGESILGSTSLTSKLTDQLALKYFIGRNKSEEENDLIVNDDNDGGVTPLFGGYVDRVLRNVKSPPSPPETEEEKQKRLEKERENKDKKKNFSVGLLELRDALITGKKIKNSESGWPSNIIVLEKEAKELLVEYINRDLDVRNNKIYENKIRHMPLYPLEVSVSIDGISGILPGNCFIVDNLPDMYKKTGVFQVVEVGHDVSSDDWSTTLRCFFRYMLDTKKPIIYYDPDENIEE